MKNVLVLCTGNSCRSQMAEGYLAVFSSSDKFTIYSAGVETHGVNPNAIKVMSMDDIDLSGHTSNHIDEYQEVEFEYILTVCDHAKEKCPYFSSKAKRFHVNFPDPGKVTGTEKEILDEFVYTRNLIKEYCKKFVDENLKNLKN